MKDYEIATIINRGLKLLFYTTAKNPKSALRRLITNSNDFKNMVERKDKRLDITIEELK